METEQKAPAPGGAGAEPVPARRSTAVEIGDAIELGWRVAALHAIRPTRLTAPSPIADGMLLNRRSLPAADRLELELRAIAGVAKRAGVPLAESELAALIALAARADSSPAAEDAFRAALAERHIAFDKQLWTASEPGGKAYEVGNFLSDSWNRVLEPRTTADAFGELREIFGPGRVDHVKVLLDDLQARIDPVAVHAVNHHLDQWRDRIRDTPLATTRAAAQKLAPEQVAARLATVERQTVIWRQMLTGDKEPEAYIGHARRAEVREELSREIWGRYRRRLYVALPLLIALGAVLGALYSRHEDVVRGVAGSALALAGALGLTRATMIGTLRRSLQSWGELMWNRALAGVICRETCVLDQVGELYPAAKRGRAGQRTNSTSTVSPAASDSRSSGTNA